MAWLVLLFAAGPPTPSLWPVAERRCHSVTAAALSPDGKTLAVDGRGWDGKPGPHQIALLDPVTLKTRETISSERHPLNALTFSADGRRLYGIAHNQRHCVAWDVQKKAVLRRWEGPRGSSAG